MSSNALDRLAELLRRRVGRRGAALLTFAFIDLVIGYSLLDPAAQPRTPTALQSYGAMLALAPFPIWGWLWIAVGVLCGAQAFWVRDIVGFTAAIAIKVVWAILFAASWLLYDAPRGFMGAATWLVIAAFVAIIAGWAEPEADR